LIIMKKVLIGNIIENMVGIANNEPSI